MKVNLKSLLFLSAIWVLGCSAERVIVPDGNSSSDAGTQDTIVQVDDSGNPVDVTTQLDIPTTPDVSMSSTLQFVIDTLKLPANGNMYAIDLDGKYDPTDNKLGDIFGLLALSGIGVMEMQKPLQQWILMVMQLVGLLENQKTICIMFWNG